MTRPVSLAFSPDTDDAFMVHAMRVGLVDCRGYDFRYTAADIQRLNEDAKGLVHDVTAISVAAYPSLAADYLLMPVGASVGDEFGPALIVTHESPLKDPMALAGKRVAVPGLQTSAYFAARGMIGEFTAVPMSFLDIADAVRGGQVDAGLLIHELQIDCERHGFRKLGDLGRMWHERFRLPLPLGANAIKRSLGLPAIREITDVMRQSIVTGLERREETLREALRQSKADLDLAKGDQYISMYVNRRSLNLDPDVKEAIRRLYALGHEAGLCPAVRLDEALYE